MIGLFPRNRSQDPQMRPLLIPVLKQIPKIVARQPYIFQPPVIFAY